MRRLLKTNPTALALCANAFVLLLILLVISARDSRLFSGSPAYGQYAPAPGPLTVMPAQLSPNTWGCYVMDAQNQTLCVYRFDPGQPLLRLAAARDIQYDRRLPLFNTTPSPTEIKAWLDRADEGVRAAPPQPIDRPKPTSPDPGQSFIPMLMT